MTDLFLIAHKVRNEPAFDIACRIVCAECNGHGDLNIADATFIGCNECDNLGYWWIIPTSGHRAYPFFNESFNMIEGIGMGFTDAIASAMPHSLPDHYPTRSTPTISLAEALGLNKPKPQAPIVRRI